MPKNALYFPYIVVPNTAWTTQAILYWDKLATIVPMDFMDRPEQMDDFTRRLLTEGLVEPIIPGQFLYEVERFDDCFIRFVEQRVLPRRLFSGIDASKGRTRIHAEKLGQVPDFLVDAGLATRIDWSWYEIETSIANQFMAYLATVLGAIPGVNATPITDKAAFASILGTARSSSRSTGHLHAHKASDVILKALLPMPAVPVDVDALLHFKQRHQSLLLPLRTKIEAHCGQVATLPAPDDRETATRAFVMDCESQVAEIEAAMKPAFGKVIFGSIAPLFGAGLALQATDHGNAVAYAGAALSLAGNAYQAIASVRGNRDTLLARPLAYIAHARRTL